MKLLMQAFLIISWGSLIQSQTDNFAAVPGTGWTDITQLQSTCSLPGYFVNPSDCSRFYVCVDHSTAEKSLLLRYDFDCPGGLAFDESTKNCNYPGPSGCVTSSSGWGWSNQNSGIWQNTATVSQIPSWGTPTKHPVSTTVVRVPGSSGGGTIVRVPSTTPAPLPSNPRLNVPSTTIVQIPVSFWESLRLRPGNSRVFESARISSTSSSTSNGGGWSSTKVVNTPGIFQSAKVTHSNTQTQQSPNVVEWGTSKILPIDTTGVFQGARVTPVPPAEWEVPQSFPQTTPVKVVQQPGSGWSNVRISATPTPAPANPAIQGGGIVYSTPSPQTVSWESSGISHHHRPQAVVSFQSTNAANPQVQVQNIGWQGSRVSQIPQPHAPVTWESNRISQVPQTPSVAWQSARISQGQVQVQQNHGDWNAPPQPSNPSLNFGQGGSDSSIHLIQGNTHAANPSYNQVNANSVASNPRVTIPAGWENFRFTQLPSGYIWQSNANTQETNGGTETLGESTPIAPSSPLNLPLANFATSAHGDFGIVQQVINEEQSQGSGASGGSGGKSHIQLIYESKLENQLAQQQQSQNIPSQNLAVQAISSSSTDSANNNANIYEFVPPPESGIKGRIIVLYAPLNTKGGKREAPVIEVEVEEDNDNDGHTGESNNA